MANGDKMSEYPKNYQSYLLRIWQAIEGGQLTWRASLQDVKSGKIQPFASMDLFIQYVNERTSQLNNERRGDPK